MKYKYFFYNLFYKIIKKMYSLHWVGFEPTRLAPCELESHPLDRSGTNALKNE
jgi:hypothetical protein